MCNLLFRYEFILVNETDIKKFGIVPAQMNLVISNVRNFALFR